MKKRGMKDIIMVETGRLSCILETWIYILKIKLRVYNCFLIISIGGLKKVVFESWQLIIIPKIKISLFSVYNKKEHQDVLKPVNCHQGQEELKKKTNYL